MLTKSRPEVAREYFEQAQIDAGMRWQLYQHLASRSLGGNGKPTAAALAASEIETAAKEHS